MTKADGKERQLAHLRARRLNACVSPIVAAMLPPDELTVSEWADKYRRLSSEASAEPGQWHTSRTPYLREIMDCFTDPNVRRIVFVAASQIGKTEAELNIIGYIIDADPGSILFIHPTTIDAKEFSKLRIAPMLRDSPTLAEKVASPKSRDSGNTILQKTYPGGILTLCGSTEAHALASKPIRYVLGDERDRWATSAGNEGDPWSLAMARQTTFYNAKAVEVSTPTVRSASAIEGSFSEGTMERWKTQCPHCGKYHEISFDDIRFEHETKIVAGCKTHTVTSVLYVCPECACVSSEYDMKHAPSRWEADNPDAYANGVRSFWLNAFVSPWASWESIILKYLQAIGDSRKLQVVYNTCFGLLWEDRGGIQDEDTLMARREDYGRRPDGSEVELPEGVLVLTCGVDTQDDRLEYEVVGHGMFGETWGIAHGRIDGKPDVDATWAALDDVIEHVYRFVDGVGLPVSCTFVDEGGHYTQNVRQQCYKRIGKKVFCIKGMAGPDKPFTAPPKKMKIVIGGTYIGECWQYQLGVDAGKQMIMDALSVQTPGAKYCHFPRRDDYGSAYFGQLLSEKLVYKSDRKQPWVWEKIPGHERNEGLDVRNYALAAFKVLPKSLDELSRRLKAARGNIVPAVPAEAAATQSAVPKRKRRSAANKYYDSW